jgi:hypothetical protein
MHTISRMLFKSKDSCPGINPFWWFFLLLFVMSCVNSFADDHKAQLNERVIGDYQLQGVMETASGLRLGPDGTYEFFLSYGSVDEADKGKWHVEGPSVVLKSTMSDVDPQYVFLRSGKEDFPGVRVSFEGEGANAVAFYTQVVIHSNGRRFMANEGYENYKQSGSAIAPITKISLSLIGALRQYQVFDFRPADPSHNHFVFRLNVGNYGYVRFDGARLRVGDGELYMKLPSMRQEFKYVRGKGKQ